MIGSDQVPEIVEDLAVPGQQRPVVGGEAAQREKIEERAAGEQDDEQDREQESRDRVTDDDGARGPHVELRAVLDRLADAERDRDQVGQQRQPDAERYRDRQLLLDELQNGGVAEIALAEIEAGVVPQHQEEALVGRLVEAELLFQALDEFRVEALGAAIFGGRRIHGAAARLPARAEVAARRARDARGRAGIGAGQLRDHALDRPAGRELHHHERDQHDAEQGRDHEQDAPDDVGGHCSHRVSRSSSAASFREPRIGRFRTSRSEACALTGGLQVERTPIATLPEIVRVLLRNICHRPADARRRSAHAYPSRSIFAALSRSCHQVSGMPRA